MHRSTADSTQWVSSAHFTHLDSIASVLPAIESDAAPISVLGPKNLSSISPVGIEKLLRWETLLRAAVVIQRAYRWHVASIRAMRPRHGRKRVGKKMITNDQRTVLYNIMNGCSNAEEKLDLWRSVIEIRRTRPQYSSDACLRALIECKGDLNRALIVTGNAAFGWRNADDLSSESRGKVLPCAADDHPRGLVEGAGGSGGSAGRDYSHSIQPGSPARGGVRHLREYRFQKDLLERERARGRLLDLSSVVSRIYFSKLYCNSPFMATRPLARHNSPKHDR